MLPDVIPHGYRCYTALPGPAGKPDGTSVSVTKSLTAYLTDRKAGHFWGRSPAGLSFWEEALRGRREGKPPSWPVLSGGGGVAGHVTCRPSLPCAA